MRSDGGGGVKMNGKERFSPTLFVTPASRPSRVTTMSTYEAEKQTPKSLTVGTVVDDHTRIRGRGKKTRNDDSYGRYSESRIDGGSKLEAYLSSQDTTASQSPNDDEPSGTYKSARERLTSA